MKYNIVINQLVLSKTNLDLVDGAILDFLYIYCSSLSPKVEKNRMTDDKGIKWTWLNYEALLANMPLLHIKSKGALTPRLKKIAETGFIQLSRVDHQKLYIRLMPKIDTLFIAVNRAIHEDEQSYSPRRTNNTIIDNSITLSKDKGDKSPSSKKCFNPEGNHKNCVDNIEFLDEKYNKHLIANPKNFRYLEALYKAGASDAMIDRIVNKFTKDPFYTEQGWDLKNVFDQYTKGGANVSTRS